MAPPRGAACFAHKPELLVFAVDADHELVASEAVPGWTRLDAVAHAVGALTAAKARVDARHRFALVALREGAEAVADSVTASPDALAARVRALGGAGGGGPGQSYASFEMASLPRAVEGFQVS
jgi:predicted hotdog family 3-hydroxylacyl-ACP dehydratase